MFKLYYYVEKNHPVMVFMNNDLKPCLDFIKSNKYILQHCMIISPNSRKITFNFNNEIMFAGFDKGIYCEC